MWNVLGEKRPMVAKLHESLEPPSLVQHTHTHSASNLLLHCVLVLVLILIRILFAVLRLCNIKFELTLTRWPIHTGYGTMRVYRVILAELPNQFEEKRNAFPIIDLAWRLSVTQHQTCLSSHIHSNVLYILFCIFISGAIVLSQVIRTIMHCNKIIPFFQWNLFLSLL